METEAGTPRSYGLRERKRTRTRLMIQTEALRLFDEKGYADTTVEEIADAAAISPRTFFRYFPTKEDVVLWDEFDPVAMDLLESVPDGMPLAETVRAGHPRDAERPLPARPWAASHENPVDLHRSGAPRTLPR